MDALYVLWKREVLKFFRTKTRIIGGLGTPLLFLIVLGSGLDKVVALNGVSYLQFLLPGVVAMAVLFSSMFSGINVVYDRQFGFLKEILVAPVSRFSIVLGRALGGATIALIQALLLIIIAFLFGVRFNPSSLFLALPVMLVIAFAFTCFGLAIAAHMEDFQGFQLIINFLMMPMFFFSGALFPLDQLPDWLRIVAWINPLTYGVETLRAVMLGVSTVAVFWAFVILCLFALASLAAATWLFSQNE